MRDVAGAFAFEIVHIEALAVNVIHKNFAAIFRGPGSALVNEQASVRVPAARGVRPAIGGVRTLRAGVVEVVGDRFNFVEGVRIER